MTEKIALNSNLHAGSFLTGLERGLGAVDTILEQTIKTGRIGVENMGLVPRLARVGGSALSAAGSEVLNVIDTDRADKAAQRHHLQRYEGLRTFDSMLVLGTFGEDVTRKTRDARALGSLVTAEKAFAIRRDMLLGVWTMESVRDSEKRRTVLGASARALRRQIIGRYGLHMLAGEEPIKVTDPEQSTARQQLRPYEQLERAVCEVEIEAQNKEMADAPLCVLVMVDERSSSRMLGIKESWLKNGGLVYLDRVGRSIQDLIWAELPTKTTVTDKIDDAAYPHRERRFTHGGTDRRRGERRSNHPKRIRQTERGGVS